MSQEIERKFIVLNSDYKKGCEGVRYLQGYLCTEKKSVVRVRIMGKRAVLTIKGATKGLTRPEFEYPIPLEDAKALLDLCQLPLIEKIRYKIPYEGMIWEVDEFRGLNEGLVLAEIELSREDQPFIKPAWIGDEVTHDHRYANSNLALFPYSTWKNKQ